MFSGNHKISSRQLYRNYATAFISLGALLPPLVISQDEMDQGLEIMKKTLS